ncbi:MAG: heparinase II/III family protein [Gemmatimonadaceae bacterium]|nr:heparinase II/III family protein [Gemmatimonadaceae bacterium]
MKTPGVRLLPFDLDARRALVRSDVAAEHAPFAVLADSLQQDLEPLIDAPLPIPGHKARLTRYGGRCPSHGVFLDFDPWMPHDHWCAMCNSAYQGRIHDDWWAMGAQLWTAERAVHAASLFVLRGDVRHATLAARILRTYYERYDSWPNRDNVLGPTRPFFSTYLESIWLINLCHALSLLEGRTDQWTAGDGAAMRDRLLAPSASLIASYHEGGSNRQVWNEVAIGSAWCLLDRADDVRRRLDREGGVRWQIANGLDDAGSWYEGENYHLFAHRGLWYGVQLMRVLDEPMSDALNERFSAGFVAPFAGVLPDDTFPSRRDSQYASSIRQWRTAEWCELGWAHTHDRRLAGVLSRLYDGTCTRRETGRWRSTADAERNTPASALTRADLSWRALLMADGPPPPNLTMPVESVCLPAQGLAVIRRDAGRVYVALEGGQLGGGHGHPDQLALTLQTGPARWLDDPGTGSYVEAELHWYRSTLAHAAPLFDRSSQRPVSAQLLAFEDQGDVAWMMKRVDGIADGVQVDRTIVVADGYLVDVVEWTSDEPHSFELPIAGRADLVAPLDERFASATPSDVRHDAVEVFLGQLVMQPLNEPLVLRPYASYADPDRRGDALRATSTESVRGDCAQAWYVVHGSCISTRESAYLMRSLVPAAPWHGMTDRHWIYGYGAHGRVIGIWSWPSERWPEGRVLSVHLTPDTTPCVAVVTRDGVTEAHGRDEAGWHIASDDGPSRRAYHLGGFRPPPTPDGKGDIAPVTARCDIVVPLVAELPDDQLAGTRIDGAHRIELGEAHYVQTESSWSDVGRPSASVQLCATADWLVVDVLARTGSVTTGVPDLLGRLDNEVPYVNADGLQWYMARADVPASPARGWHAAALHVPSADPALRALGTAIRIAGSVESVQASWREMPEGWAMRLRWDRATLPLDADGALFFELVINERPPDRERRRGQLVLSGGGGFGYLMGDRRPTNRFVRLKMS